MKIWLLFSIFILGLIPILFRFHLVEKDFGEIVGAADGFYSAQKYCFLELENYTGLSQLTGLQGRPPLVPLLLSMSFRVLGHNLLAVYLVYMLPRLLIFPLLYLIALRFFKPSISFCIASLALFFPFFDTYALSTLKADVFVVAWSLLGLFFHLVWKKGGKPRYLLFSSIFLCLNILSKETALYFSVTLWLIQIFDLMKLPRKRILILSIVGPPVVLILPFIVFSLFTVGRIFPSLFATAFHPPSFPINITTYISSMFYFAGISFGLSKFLTLMSLIKIAIILLGIFVAAKEKKYELLLPIFAVLFSISLIHTRVIQGDSINREVLHRIAPVVPFVALFVGFGLQALVQICFKNRRRYEFLELLFFLLVEIFFMFQYFRAPFALDYTDAEFYINGRSILTHKPKIPLSTFVEKNQLCVMKSIPTRTFLLNEYVEYKTSAFPKGLKELLIATWVTALLVNFILSRKSLPQVTK